MARRRGPEDFYEVFKEVQDSKRDSAEEPAQEDAGAVPARPTRAADGVTVSYPLAGAFVVGAVLLMIMAYLLGKQHGFALARRPRASQPTSAAPSTAAPGPVVSDEPEFVDNKIFTLLVSGAGDGDRRSAQEEADYLNRYEPFKALRVQAYVWRDSRRRYRVCARGLAAVSPEDRERVKKEIRKLDSRFGKREYKDADFYPR